MPEVASDPVSAYEAVASRIAGSERSIKLLREAIGFLQRRSEKRGPVYKPQSRMHRYLGPFLTEYTPDSAHAYDRDDEEYQSKSVKGVLASLSNGEPTYVKPALVFLATWHEPEAEWFFEKVREDYYAPPPVEGAIEPPTEAHKKSAIATPKGWSEAQLKRVVGDALAQFLQSKFSKLSKLVGGTRNLAIISILASVVPIFLVYILVSNSISSQHLLTEIDADASKGEMSDAFATADAMSITSSLEYLDLVADDFSDEPLIRSIIRSRVGLRRALVGQQSVDSPLDAPRRTAPFSTEVRFQSFLDSFIQNNAAEFDEIYVEFNALRSATPNEYARAFDLIYDLHTAHSEASSLCAVAPTVAFEIADRFHANTLLLIVALRCTQEYGDFTPYNFIFNSTSICDLEVNIYSNFCFINRYAFYTNSGETALAFEIVESAAAWASDQNLSGLEALWWLEGAALRRSSDLYNVDDWLPLLVRSADIADQIVNIEQRFQVYRALFHGYGDWPVHNAVTALNWGRKAFALVETSNAPQVDAARGFLMAYAGLESMWEQGDPIRSKEVSEFLISEIDPNNWSDHIDLADLWASIARAERSLENLDASDQAWRRAQESADLAIEALAVLSSPQVGTASLQDPVFRDREHLLLRLFDLRMRGRLDRLYAMMLDDLSQLDKADSGVSDYYAATLVRRYQNLKLVMMQNPGIAELQMAQHTIFEQAREIRELDNLSRVQDRSILEMMSEIAFSSDDIQGENELYTELYSASVSGPLEELGLTPGSLLEAANAPTIAVDDGQVIVQLPCRSQTWANSQQTVAASDFLYANRQRDNSSLPFGDSVSYLIILMCADLTGEPPLRRLGRLYELSSAGFDYFFETNNISGLLVSHHYSVRFRQAADEQDSTHPYNRDMIWRQGALINSYTFYLLQRDYRSATQTVLDIEELNHSFETQCEFCDEWLATIHEARIAAQSPAQ